MIYSDKKTSTTVIDLWKLKIKIQENKKSYLGNWSFGDGTKLVGSFTLIKK